MERNTVSIASLKVKIERTKNAINEFVSRINTGDPLTIVANAEKLVTLQKEYQMIKTLEMFVQVLEENLDPMIYLDRLQDEIMSERGFKSYYLANNIIEQYRFDGKREAFVYLKKLLKSL
jgi:hypothetical protein